MRKVHYDLAQLTLPAEWVKAVTNLRTAISVEKDSVARSALIEKNSDLWKSIKPQLAKLFNYKCWYTESPQQGTDVDVDHYRPKKRVADVMLNQVEHPGYWWLAFELSNYRYSCIVANRRRKDIETGIVGGKSDHFPINNENTRAWLPTDMLDDEQPDLLDPCIAADVALLDFKEDGEAMPRFAQADRPRAFRRADTSIRLYNLNHTDFTRARIELRDELSKQLKNARRYFQKLENGDADHEAAYGTAIEALRNMIDARAPYSSFCLSYLQRYQNDEAIFGVFM